MIRRGQQEGIVNIKRDEEEKNKRGELDSGSNLLDRVEMLLITGAIDWIDREFLLSELLVGSNFVKAYFGCCRYIQSAEPNVCFSLMDDFHVDDYLHIWTCGRLLLSKRQII